MFTLHYNGIYLQPHKKIESSTMAYLTNNEKDDMILFLLSPGLFQDAFKLASNPTYRNVYIFTPSNNFLFLSDLVRLQNELDKIKLNCKVVYPVNIDDNYTNMSFKNNFIRRNSIILKEDDNLSSIKYVKTPLENVYNIHVSTKNGGYVFSSYLDENILNELNSDYSINEIHLYYTTTLFGGLTFKDLKTNYELRKQTPKLRCNGFLNEEEFYDCKNKYESFIVKRNYE